MKQLKFGLIGYPLGHSFSASYFSEKFSKAGINATYQNFPIKHVDELVAFFAEFPDLDGLNITVPWKEKVLGFCQFLSPEAKSIGAVNCIKRRSDGRLEGHNTDWIGFTSSVRVFLGENKIEKALIFGTGGSSKAVLFSLEQMGVEATLVSSSNKGLGYSELQGCLHRYQLLVQTTPLGMYPLQEEYPIIPYSELGNSHFCFDLIYNPVKTIFLKKAEWQGAAIRNGAEMLQIQAEESWKIWIGGGLPSE